MDVFLMRVTAQDQFELRRCDQLTNNVQNIIPNNPFSSRKVTNGHFNNPALHIRERIPAPQLDIFLHRDILRLPMIVLHIFIQIVSPLIL